MVFDKSVKYAFRLISGIYNNALKTRTLYLPHNSNVGFKYWYDDIIVEIDILYN